MILKLIRRFKINKLRINTPTKKGKEAILNQMNTKHYTLDIKAIPKHKNE